jgi:microcystin-dependent protein
MYTRNLLIIDIFIIIFFIYLFYTREGFFITSSTVSTPLALGINNLQLVDENGNMGYIQFPTGIMVIWKGTSYTIPQGWALCDGTLGTPDLRGKFVIGVNPQANKNALFSNKEVGTSGGSINTTITNRNIPNHVHSFNDSFMSANNATVTPGLNSNYTNNKWPGNGDIDHDNSPTAFLSKTELSSSNSNSVLIDLIPTYYSLCYIMKL